LDKPFVDGQQNKPSEKERSLLVMEEEKAAYAEAAAEEAAEQRIKLLQQ